MRGERPSQYLKSVRARARARIHTVVRPFYLKLGAVKPVAVAWLRRCVDLHTQVHRCARFISISFCLLPPCSSYSLAIGGRTSLSSFPMGTIPHGIYNNNGPTSVGDGSIFIYLFFVSCFFLLPPPSPSPLYVASTSFFALLSLPFPLGFLRSFLRSYVLRPLLVSLLAHS
jgi:hypothetical protein